MCGLLANSRSLQPSAVLDTGEKRCPRLRWIRGMCRWLARRTIVAWFSPTRCNSRWLAAFIQTHSLLRGAYMVRDTLLSQ